jgi:hypothetical protein
MAARDKNRKVAEALLELVYDTRFDPAKFAHFLVDGGDAHINKRMLEVLTHYCEFLAIRYDYGDFTGTEYPWLKQAAQIRDVITSQSIGSA